MAAAVAALHDGFNVSGDSHLFLEYGRTLLSSHWNQAFSYSAVQVGPLQLLLYGSVGRSTVALAVFLSVATALLVLATARVVGVKTRRCSAGWGSSRLSPASRESGTESAIPRIRSFR